MGYRDRNQQRTFFRGRERSRLFMLVLMLAFLAVAIPRTRDPRMWSWLKSGEITRTETMAADPVAMAGLNSGGPWAHQRFVMADAPAAAPEVAPVAPAPAAKAPETKTSESKTADDSANSPSQHQPGPAPAASKQSGANDVEPLDHDELELRALKEESQLLKDGSLASAPLEMAAYWRLMRWAEKMPLDDMAKRAVPANYRELLKAPSKYRGKLVRLEMNARKITSSPAPADNPLGLTTTYELWGTTKESEGRLFNIQAGHLPVGMALGPRVDEDIIVYGYFLKLQGYLPGGAEPNSKPLYSPVIIGRVMLKKPKDAATQAAVAAAAPVAVAVAGAPADKPADTPAADAPAAATPPGATSGPLDADVKERDALGEEIEGIKDKITDLDRQQPKGAYWRLMRWAQTGQMPDLSRRAVQGTLYNDFVQYSDKYRGKLVRLDLHVKQIVAYDAPADNAAGVKTIYQLSGPTEESQGFPFLVDTPVLPTGMALGSNLKEEVTVYGYFLRLQGYQPVGAAPGAKPLYAPLIIGRVVWHRAPETPPAPEAGVWIWVWLIVAAIVATAGWAAATGLFRKRSVTADARADLKRQGFSPFEQDETSEKPDEEAESEDEGGFDFNPNASGEDDAAIKEPTIDDTSLDIDVGTPRPDKDKPAGPG
ncbi:MAG: hypothetical protein K8T25_22790 [Planctomycetia bacterium]|nr:hypothetical protein [Planctomycetia bacterium]